ncbi:6442_t:CDS:1, partial [Gigaspora rosea]
KIQKLPAIIEPLGGNTKKYVMELADIVQAKHSSDNNFDSNDDDNPIYYGNSLLIIEQNEIGLAQQNI